MQILTFIVYIGSSEKKSKRPAGDDGKLGLKKKKGDVLGKRMLFSTMYIYFIHICTHVHTQTHIHI